MTNQQLWEQSIKNADLTQIETLLHNKIDFDLPENYLVYQEVAAKENIEVTTLLKILCYCLGVIVDCKFHLSISNKELAYLQIKLDYYTHKIEDFTDTHKKMQKYLIAKLESEINNLETQDASRINKTNNLLKVLHLTLKRGQKFSQLYFSSFL